MLHAFESAGGFLPAFQLPALGRCVSPLLPTLLIPARGIFTTLHAGTVRSFSVPSPVIRSMPSVITSSIPIAPAALSVFLLGGVTPFSWIVDDLRFHWLAA
jgi:hypothetical protein